MKKRSECFFGMHFDFHASAGTVGIGRDFDGRILDALLKETRPDFVQCDTKGHPGYACYPSEICAHPDDIVLDILKEWRKITEENGVLLYAHHSGVWDFLAVGEHPEWAAVDENGQPSDQATSLFGAYADEKLIPHLCELAGKYRLNGAWVDGDGWGAMPDYSEQAKRAWEEATGKKVPGKEDDLHRAYLDFQRSAFVRYVRHYVETVKEKYPDFEIASNWMNTSCVPVDENVTDFISGDMATTECADSARFEARVIADYGRPWDLMAWGFYPKSRNIKSAEQLCQELALVFSVGGGVQVYFPQDPVAVIRNDDIVRQTMRRIADFCHARRDCCQGAKVVPTVGVIFSAQAFYKDKERIFADWEGQFYNSGVRGMVNLLLDSQSPAEILRATTLKDRDLSPYSMLVLPESPDLEDGVEEFLVDYAKAGGTLVLSGVETLKRFAPWLGLSGHVESESAETALRMDGGLEYISGIPIDLCGACVQLIKSDIRSADGTHRAATALWELPIGRGKVYLIGFNAGLIYLNNHSFVMRRFMRDLLDRVLPPLRGYGSQNVTISLMEKGGKEYIHLVNMNGDGRSARCECFDEIAPIFDFQICYRTKRAPKSVRSLPSGESVRFRYENDMLTFICNELDIHACFELEF